MNKVVNTPMTYGPDGGRMAMDPESFEDQFGDPREVLRKLRRRKGLILSTTLLLTFVAALYVLQLDHKYTAEALIMIESRQSNVVNVEEVVSGLSADTKTVRGQIEVLRSRTLAEKVVDKLRLYNDPEFNATLRPAEWTDEIFSLDTYVPREWLVAIGLKKDRKMSEEDLVARERRWVVNSFLNNLEVERKKKSPVIEVEFESERPKMASTIANTLADLYIVEQLEAKFEATQRVTAWLNERLSTLREKVLASERAVEEYRRDAGLLEGKGETITSQQVSEINTQIILASTARAEAEARLRQTRNLISSQDGVDTAAEVLESQLIQRLKEQETVVLRKAAELSTQYGERHPKMINVRAEIADVKQKIETEVRKIVKGLENEVSIARTRERTLRTNLDRVQNRLGASNEAEVQLRALEREAEANRTLLETFLNRFKETSAQEDKDIQQADARVISRAAVPDLPSHPKRKRIILMAFVASLFVGVAAALAIEFLDHGFRSGDQVETATGVPVLGLVPLLAGFAKLSKRPDSYIIDRPNSAFGESIRTLRTGLYLSRIDAPPKKILITSAQPSEGKTTVAVCLARMHALAGHKVMLVDADLRRPGVHQALGMRNAPGLTELLAGEAEISDVLQKDERSGAHVIAAGMTPPNPPDMLASELMAKLLDHLAASYDMVVLDSPPVLAVSDARILAKQADTTAFVIHWGETSRVAVRQAMKELMNTGVKVGGAVLTMVNARRHASYSYGDSGYYYGRMKKYYTG